MATTETSWPVKSPKKFSKSKESSVASTIQFANLPIVTLAWRDSVQRLQEHNCSSIRLPETNQSQKVPSPRKRRFRRKTLPEGAGERGNGMSMAQPREHVAF